MFCGKVVCVLLECWLDWLLWWSCCVVWLLCGWFCSGVFWWWCWWLLEWCVLFWVCWRVFFCFFGDCCCRWVVVFWVVLGVLLDCWLCDCFCCVGFWVVLGFFFVVWCLIFWLWCCWVVWSWIWLMFIGWFFWISVIGVLEWVCRWSMFWWCNCGWWLCVCCCWVYVWSLVVWCCVLDWCCVVSLLEFLFWVWMFWLGCVCVWGVVCLFWEIRSVWEGDVLVILVVYVVGVCSLVVGCWCVLMFLSVGFLVVVRLDWWVWWFCCEGRVWVLCLFDCCGCGLCEGGVLDCWDVWLVCFWFMSVCFCNFFVLWLSCFWGCLIVWIVCWGLVWLILCWVCCVYRVCVCVLLS